jgi:hypothetical protein
MKPAFASLLAPELATFLAFKRARGYRYQRAEFMLRSFDHFLASYVRRRRRWQVDHAILAWLARRPDRKAISVAMELSVIRELWRYLHRINSDALPVSHAGRDYPWSRALSHTCFLASTFVSCFGSSVG